MKPDLVLKLNTLVFILTSMTCYQGTTHGYPWLGLVALAIHYSLFLPATTTKAKRVLVAILTGLIGFIADSTLIWLGVYSVSSGSRWLLPDPLCPEWILVLWLNFGFMLYIFWQILAKSRWTPPIIGIIFSFIIMGNASHMGLIAFRAPSWHGYLIIAACWSVLVPIFALYSNRCFGENHVRT
ncbi:MAG TPA: hypothetical protein DCG57_21760 [Candidatus Riflebacteria bacterium]|nr:hypothetical protein [Candidatus Riflebacteria bacterium]